MLLYVADVVYDTSIIDALVRVIQWLLSWPRKSTDGRSPVMYIASTVRNTATRDSFLKALGNTSLLTGYLCSLYSLCTILLSCISYIILCL